MSAGSTDRLAEARRALLAQRLRAHTSPMAAAVPQVIRRTEPGPAPLSISQRQLWYLSQLAPESIAYNELVTIRKTGTFDAVALRRAFTEVVRRHEMWRTTFPVLDGEPRQRVHEPPTFELPLLDLSALSFTEAEQQAAELAAADTRRRYDLVSGPLLRPRLVRLAADHHRLYLGLHHLLFDGVTLYRIVLPELVTLYNAYAAGLASPLPEPELQYADYAAWELDWVDGPVAAARIERWRKRLNGAGPLGLPLDHPRPERRRFAGGMVALRIERATAQRLRALGHSHRASFFHVLAAAYVWWLHRYTGEDDITFATMGDLRARPELAQLAGYCLAPVVIRTDTTGDLSFAGLLARVRTTVLDGLDDAVPFELLVRQLGTARDPRMNPVFQATLVLEPPMVSSDPEWSVHQMESAIGDAVGSAKFDLSIELDERPERHVAGRLIYDADVFTRSSAEQMARHWTRLLDVLAAAPDAPLAGLDLLDERERHRQLIEWNPAPRTAPATRCVHELIDEQAARTPEAVAVVVGDEQLSYRQLEERATALAARLVAAGAGSGVIVATVLDRGTDLVVALLGILKSGAAYLPLDPKQPTRRSAYMIDDAGARLLLSRSTLLGELPDFGVTVLTVDGAPSEVAPTLPATARARPCDLAYVIYTSGSTGAPKGVLVEHRNVTQLMTTLLPRLGVTTTDTVLSVASYTFDMSVGDIFGTLGVGARLVLASTEQAADPRVLGTLIDRCGATVMRATPTTWSALLDAGWAGGSRLTAVSGGEPLPESLIRTLLGRCAAVWNGYGPTETTVVASCGQMADGEPVTTGHPLPRTRVYVLDPAGRLVPSGVPGEIVIGGAGVARGYLNRPAETAERFGVDPFVEGGRIYRTGDRGRFLADGRLQHLGRYDEQVKIRGFRIEPGEIEAALAEHPGVTASVVVARKGGDGETQLVAYVVGTPTSATALRSWLRSRLPDYMVPGAIVALPALPLAPSGKVDRAALPAPASQRPDLPGGQAPRTPTEKRLAALWSAALPAEVIDVHADFFDLGGHSLLAARLIAGTEAEFGRSVALADFLGRDTTIAGLAALLADQPAADTRVISTRPPLFFVYPDLVSAVSLRHLAHAWGDEQRVHPLVPAQPDGRFEPASTVEGLVKPLILELRKAQPNGPYALAGFSLGGLLAYEIARELSAAGEHIEWLGLLDTPTQATAELLLRQISPWGRFKRLRGGTRRQRWAKYREVAVRTISEGPNAPSPAEHFDFRGAVEITHRYAKPGHRLPMDLFVTADSAAEVDSVSLGWDTFHRGPMHPHPLPGDHDTLLDQPQVTDVARLLLSCIQRSRPS